MQNIQVLRQKKADTLAKAKAILNSAAKDNNRDLTDAERAEYDACFASIDTLNADIARVERLLDLEREAPAQDPPSLRGAGGTTVSDNAEKQSFAGLGEFLLAVKQATIGGGFDPRLRPFQRSHGAMAAALGSNEGLDSEGGFLVLPEYQNVLWKRIYDVGQLIGMCTPLPMKSNRLMFPAVDEDSRVDGQRWGGIQVFRAPEAGTYTPTMPKFRQIQLTAKKLIGLCYLTEELEADQDLLQAYVNQAIPDEFSYQFDREIMFGNGAIEMLGFMKSAALVTVAADGGQASKTVSTTNITNMISRLPARSMSRSVWIINQDVLPALFPLTLGSGTAVVLIFKPADPNTNTANSQGPYGTLMGRPVYAMEQSSTLGTLGDVCLVDLSQYYVGTRSTMRADSSIHVQFVTGQNTLRFMARNDGQPAWKKPLTPASGSTNTLSPFLTLAARP